MSDDKIDQSIISLSDDIAKAVLYSYSMHIINSLAKRRDDLASIQKRISSEAFRQMTGITINIEGSKRGSVVTTSSNIDTSIQRLKDCWNKDVFWRDDPNSANLSICTLKIDGWEVAKDKNSNKGVRLSKGRLCTSKLDRNFSSMEDYWLSAKEYR